MSKSFDIIVVGAGHAGVEASTACARMGQKTLLVTNNLDRISYMSCNPSIGGLGKGHIVKEIDAMGGVMALATDNTCVQFKRLNARKGPAVRGSRAQCDKKLYSNFMRDWVLSQENLTVSGAEITKLLIQNGECKGVITQDGSKIYAKAVIITAGTFLRAVMHIGLKKIEGGRVGDKASYGLSEQLAAEGFQVARLKTGTPPRLLRKSIDFSKTEAHGGDAKFIPFSFLSDKTLKHPQIECYLSYTNEKTHDIIRKNLKLSPMFTGAIEGIGPRYCPSIEDKITRFENRDRHQTFLEPEGINSDSIYLQGISTSLPENVQIEFLQSIPGLEKVELIRPGYAVEYDFFEPHQIWPTLETRAISGLYFAGQINGTSGYEEAAGQGLVAGINAALKIQNKEPLVLGRAESYIGVLIDDLITKGTKEPYRMMTSRAEHRLHLREDNSLERLSEKAFAVGSLSEKSFFVAKNILEAREKLMTRLEQTVVSPKASNQEILRALSSPVLQKPQSLKELLRRVEISCLDLKNFGIDVPEEENIYEPVEIAVKYEGYIKRELELIEQTKKLESLKIPSDINYGSVRGLSSEETEKLLKIRPITLGQAKQISGVNPSAIQALVIHLKARENRAERVL